MLDSMLILIAAAFLLAGFIKGVLGLGLPTVSMGLLAVTMPPGQAIAIVIVPATLVAPSCAATHRFMRAIDSPCRPWRSSVCVGPSPAVIRH